MTCDYYANISRTTFVLPILNFTYCKYRILQVVKFPWEVYLWSETVFTCSIMLLLQNRDACPQRPKGGNKIRISGHY